MRTGLGGCFLFPGPFGHFSNCSVKHSINVIKTQQAAESTASLGSSSVLQLHPGWSPAAQRNPAGAEWGSPCLHAHLIPTPDSLIWTPKGDQDPVPSTHPPLLPWKQKGFTKTNNPSACRYSTQRFARGIHSV